MRRIKVSMLVIAAGFISGIVALFSLQDRSQNTKDALSKSDLKPAKPELMANRTGIGKYGIEKGS